MIVQTPAIVFKSVDFKESSRIITFFCRTHGKIAVLAKGIRRSKNRWAGMLSHGAVVNLVFYYKSNRSVQTFKEADTSTSTFKIQADFEKLAVSMALIELSDQVLHEHEPHEDFFDFLHNFIMWLNQADTSVQVLFPYLQLRIAELCGVGLQLNGKNPETGVGYLNVQSGNLAEEPGDGLTFRLTDAQCDYLLTAMQGRTSRLLKKEFHGQELKNLIYHLDVYLKHHIEGVRDRKSDAVFDQILLDAT